MRPLATSWRHFFVSAISFLGKKGRLSLIHRQEELDSTNVTSILAHNECKDLKEPSKRPFFHLKRINRLFFITVILPTITAIMYYGFIASDIYISQSSFVLRIPERGEVASPLGAFLQATGFASDRLDAYTIQKYITSRDALRQIDQVFDLRTAYSTEGLDILRRFPGIAWWRTSFEDLHEYYNQSIASVQIEQGTSIATLTVRAFTPDNAAQINQKLLTMSELLVNKINRRAVQDMIRHATEDVAAAEKNAKQAALALSTYQNKNNFFNLGQQSTIQLQHIAKLQEQLLNTEGLLSQLQTMTAGNPQIPSLRQKQRYLKQEIIKETNKLAGGKDSLANTAVEYERLFLDREFSSKRLASALASLEAIRNEAQRQQIYLLPIAQPSIPDQAMEPKRLHGILAVFLTCLIIYGICVILFAGVREHQS